MSKEFETKVLSALENLQTDVSGLQTDVSGLKTDVSGLKTDIARLDKKIDDQTVELKEHINLNGNYIQQAFGVISDMQKERFEDKHNVKFNVA